MSEDPAKIKRRIHIPPERWGDGTRLLPDERRYLIDVLRLGPGSLVEIFDGLGTACGARLSRDADGWRLDMGRRRVVQPDRPPLRIGVALTKGRKLDIVVRMLTEIGVESIEPFSCARSVARPTGAKAAARIERFAGIAREAARQSGRCSVPDILPLRSFDRMLADHAERLRIVMHTGDELPRLGELIACQPRADVFLMIGPEGGFTGDEIEQARRAAFRVVTLGPPTLRTETACVVAAAVLTHAARSDNAESQRKDS